MSNEHTPGPWVPGSNWFNNSDSSIIVRSRATAGHGMVACRIRSQADARLIAAAPEMLAALKGLVVAASAPSSPHVAGHGIDQSATHEGLTNCDILAAARSAINKATEEGGAS